MTKYTSSLPRGRLQTSCRDGELFPASNPWERARPYWGPIAGLQRRLAAQELQLQKACHLHTYTPKRIFMQGTLRMDIVHGHRSRLMLFHEDPFQP